VIPDPLAAFDLSASGRLDAAATIVLRDMTARAVQDGPVLVLLDITGITAIDASGVVGLLEVLHLTRARGGDLRVFGSSEGLEAVRLDAHLARIVRVYRSRRHAIDGGTGRGAHALNRTRGLHGRLAQRLRTLRPS
jgi:anti-anti-sigma factor